MTLKITKYICEKEVINTFFKQNHKDPNIKLGIGDDAAVLALSNNSLITCDTLVAKTHFAVNTNAFYLGRKSLAVNISDIAAMGGIPLYAMMSLTIPKLDKKFLAKFTKGFFDIANEHQIKLIGGDLVKGKELAITITLIGKAGKKIITQNNAKFHDDLWVSGILGKAADEFTHQAKATKTSALHNPKPQVLLGNNLAKFATTAIDLSDSLIQSIAQLEDQNQKAFAIDLKSIPIIAKIKKLPTPQIINNLSFGEDYQILFTANPKSAKQIKKFSSDKNIKLSKIGKVTKDKTSYLKINDQTIPIVKLLSKSYVHFKQPKFLDLENKIDKNVKALAKICLKQKIKIAVSESCTGGLLAANLSKLAGASKWFYGGTVVYDNSFKTKLANINSKKITKYTAVSREITHDLCKSSLALPKITHAIAITGYASATKIKRQLGQVFIASGAHKDIVVNEYKFSGDREHIRKLAVLTSIENLIKILKNNT